MQKKLEILKTILEITYSDRLESLYGIADKKLCCSNSEQIRGYGFEFKPRNSKLKTVEIFIEDDKDFNKVIKSTIYNTNRFVFNCRGKELLDPPKKVYKEFK